MKKIFNIAVLITSHNRKDSTLRCLESLYNQVLTEKTYISTYLVDAGSADGTYSCVKQGYPDVNIIQRDASLFWCGGIRDAWLASLDCDYDYFLWLNDDVYLNEDAVSELIKTAEENPGIIIGSTHDSNSFTWTYGGRSNSSGKKSLKGTPVIPNGSIQRCQQINGNIVIVPAWVVEKIGILSKHFTHAMGDFDYGFRALDAGIPLFVSPHYLGTCSQNPPSEWCDPKTLFLRRLKLFNSPKGLNFSEFMYFCWRHFGFKSILIGLKAVGRLFFPQIWFCRKGR